jgi:hypothetical protein
MGIDSASAFDGKQQQVWNAAMERRLWYNPMRSDETWLIPTDTLDT